MRCPNCGKETSKTFCANCGARVVPDTSGAGAEETADPGRTTVLNRSELAAYGQRREGDATDGRSPVVAPTVDREPSHSGTPDSPDSHGFFHNLARFAYRRPWPIVILAIIFVSVAGTLGGSVASQLQSGGFDVPGSQSVTAADRLQRATGISTTDNIIALVRLPQGVRSAAMRNEVAHVMAVMKRDPVIASVSSVYQTHDSAMISRDGKSTYVVGQFKNRGDATVRSAASRLVTALAGDPHVIVGGSTVAGVQTSDMISQDLGRAESFALPILFILLLFVFRGVIAALFPLLMGSITVLGAFFGLFIINKPYWLSVFAINLVTGLGLGLSIDYSLLITSRYREELGRVGPGFEALQRTLATSGRAVLFSSLTVTAALASLLVFPQRYLQSMAIGGMLVTIIGTLVALLVMPAILRLLGNRINALAPRRWREAAARSGSGFWYRLSRFVMAHAGVTAIVTAGVLIALGLPVLGINFISTGPTTLPTSASARQVNDVLQTQFPVDETTPVQVVATAPQSAASKIDSFAHSLSSLPNVTTVQPPQYVGGNAWRINVISKNTTFSNNSQKLVRAIRGLSAPFPTAVGGDSARFVDQKASLASRLPFALLIIAVVTLVVLFLVTGSVILPLKSVLMNLLTLSATFGALVLIFQDGNLTGIFRYTSQGAIDVSQPIVILALAFGLSTDYAVFLLARIKEQHDKGVDSEEAVASGIQFTGRIVTSAAILFCVAIGAFSTSRIIIIKELGFGTALAVLLDATIVRGFLVPSLMKLLGDRNWWAPRPLQRIYDRFKLEEPSYSAE